MITATGSLLILGVYFLVLFAFGLLWLGRERSKAKKAAPKAGFYAQTGLNAKHDEEHATTVGWR